MAAKVNIDIDPHNRPADHATVLRILAVRNRQLGSSRTRTACRLHALLAQLVPGGSTKKIKADEAQRLLDDYQPTNPAEAARRELALEHVGAASTNS